jgi:hypothetical protein
MHQVTEKWASAQSTSNLIEKAHLFVVEQNFDTFDMRCVVHGVTPWCCGFTRIGLLVLLLLKGSFLCATFRTNEIDST